MPLLWGRWPLRFPGSLGHGDGSRLAALRMGSWLGPGAHLAMLFIVRGNPLKGGKACGQLLITVSWPPSKRVPRTQPGPSDVCGVWGLGASYILHTGASPGGDSFLLPSRSPVEACVVSRAPRGARHHRQGLGGCWEGDTLGTETACEMLGESWDHSEPPFPHL